MRYGHLIAALLFLVFLLVLAVVLFINPFGVGKIGVGTPAGKSAAPTNTAQYYTQPTNVYVTSTSY